MGMVPSAPKELQQHQRRLITGYYNKQNNDEKA